MYSFLKPGVLPDPLPAKAPFIPRIIWQTTRDRHAIKPQLAQCIQTVKDMNPDWEHRQFDDQLQYEFLSRVCSDRFMAVYDRVQPKYGAAKADLFRYVAVFLYGGAYMDLKSGTTRPLDEILRPDDHFIISQWDNGPDGAFPGLGLNKDLKHIPGGEYEQWFVIASPGHPFLAAIIEQAMANAENYNPFRFGHGGKGVLNVFGPNVYTLSIRALEAKHPHRKICAWHEGLKYTLLEDLHAHQRIDSGHYNRVYLPPVTPKNLSPLKAFMFNLNEILYWPISKLRSLNHARLRRRAIRKGKPIDR